MVLYLPPPSGNICDIQILLQVALITRNFSLINCCYRARILYHSAGGAGGARAAGGALGGRESRAATPDSRVAPVRPRRSNLNTDNAAPTKIARITFGFHTA